MAQLTRGMFGGGEVRVDVEPAYELFGFSSGNCVTEDFIHNGGWYNKAGEWLGWGDLSPDNLRRLMAVLKEGEIFIILFESDRGRNGRRGNEDEPLTYLAEKAELVVVKNGLCYVDRRNGCVGSATVDLVHGLTAKVLTPDAFAKMLGVELSVA